MKITLNPPRIELGDSRWELFGNDWYRMLPDWSQFYRDKPPKKALSAFLDAKRETRKIDWSGPPLFERNPIFLAKERRELAMKRRTQASLDSDTNIIPDGMIEEDSD